MEPNLVEIRMKVLVFNTKQTQRNVPFGKLDSRLKLGKKNNYNLIDLQVMYSKIIDDFLNFYPLSHSGSLCRY